MLRTVPQAQPVAVQGRTFDVRAATYDAGQAPTSREKDRGTVTSIDVRGLNDFVVAKPKAPEQVECTPPKSVDPSNDVDIAPETVPGAQDAAELVAEGSALIDLTRDATTTTLRVIEELDHDDGESGSVQAGSQTIAVRTRPPAKRVPNLTFGTKAFSRYLAPDLGFATPTEKEQTLDTKGERLDDVQVVKTYALSPSSVTLDNVGIVRRTDGVVLDELGLKANVDDCTAAAFEHLADTRKTEMVLPSDMPPVKFPPMFNCGFDRCVKLKVAWVRAHYAAWMTHRAMEYMQELPEYYRAASWSAQGAGPDGKLTAPSVSSFAYWFGEYDAERFGAIREAMADLVRIYRTGKTGLRKVTVTCVDEDESDWCFNPWKQPAGYHIDQGDIHFCPKYFGYEDYQRIETTIHEPLHYVFVTFNGIKEALRDFWTHWHGDRCISQPDSDRMYGPERTKHLADYTNADGDDCGHRRQAVLNNSNYDEFIRRWGGMVWHGKMTKWPANVPTPPPPPEPVPTPKPPENCTLGDEGCQCAEALYRDIPEGDFDRDMICPDHNGYETTCSATTFGTQTYGVCKSCEDDRRPGGCSCTSTDQCAPGLGCFGSDTFAVGDGIVGERGDAVGHCYEQQPPQWACLADCQRLFNDEDAWCDQHYPTGGRCFDSSCTPQKVDECFRDGMVCREGACTTECDVDEDCTQLGYPASTFECVAKVCRRASWL